MIQDPTLTRAVTEIRQRADRQPDPAKLIDTFVDVGILAQLENLNNQIVYGRRGTGKTHILRVLETRLRTDERNIVQYIDARVLGSTSQFSDPEATIKHRCICLFRDMLGEISNALQNRIVNTPPADPEGALAALSELDRVITEPVTTSQDAQITKRTLNKSSTSLSTKLSLGGKDGPGFEFGGGADGAIEKENTTALKVSEEDKITFPAIYAYLKDVLEKCGARLFILLDEWSSLPREIQPYLAEFFKRSLLPNPEIVIKIGSLEYRSTFGRRQPSGDILGFELGSDIPVALDVDEYYVYDRSPFDTTNQFGKVLFKHISSELPRDYLKSAFAVVSSGKLVDRMFETLETFEELARASEGVVRDLINIFTQAYVDAQRRSRDSIDRRAVTEAARRWFEQDKQANLDDDLARVLQKIVGEVIGHRKARSFLIARELEKNTMLQGLFEARVLHRIHRGYFDKENPALKYSVYTLDYGTYVDLLDTTHRPEGFFYFSDYVPPPGTIVPFNDKRSIPKIVLAEDILKPTA